jgi:hypothetical protein
LQDTHSCCSARWLDPPNRWRAITSKNGIENSSVVSAAARSYPAPAKLKPPFVILLEQLVQRVETQLLQHEGPRIAVQLKQVGEELWISGHLCVM